MAEISFTIPADVPLHAAGDFQDNYYALSRNKNKFLLCVYDEYLEHTQEPNHQGEIHTLDHPFAVAHGAKEVCFVTHPGLIARYGREYVDINYVVKLNGIVHVDDTDENSMIAEPLMDVEELIKLREQSNLFIRGVGITMYLGGRQEAKMCEYASHTIYHAHMYGLVAIVWLHPPINWWQNDEHDLLKSVSVAASLGADVICITPPYAKPGSDEFFALEQVMKHVTHVSILGNDDYYDKELHIIQRAYDYIHRANIQGIAIGRGIFRHPVIEAVSIIKALAAVVYNNVSVDDAMSNITARSL